MFLVKTINLDTLLKHYWTIWCNEIQKEKTQTKRSPLFPLSRSSQSSEGKENRSVKRQL